MIRWKDRTSIVGRWQQYPDIAKKLSAECQNRTFTVAWKIQVECSDVISIKADFPSSSRWENRRVCGTYTAGDINVCRSTRCNVVFLLFFIFSCTIIIIMTDTFPYVLPSGLQLRSLISSCQNFFHHILYFIYCSAVMWNKEASLNFKQLDWSQILSAPKLNSESILLELLYLSSELVSSKYANSSIVCPR